VRINPRTTAKDLVKMLAETGKTVSLSTVKRFLYHHELKGYSGRRKPLLQNHHKMQDYCLQLHMGSKINFWRHILWSDETKIELFGHNDKTVYLEEKWQSFEVSEHHPNCEVWGGSIMMWGCLAAEEGTGALHKTDGIMRKYIF